MKFEFKHLSKSDNKRKKYVYLFDSERGLFSDEFKNSFNFSSFLVFEEFKFLPHFEKKILMSL